MKKITSLCLVLAILVSGFIIAAPATAESQSTDFGLISALGITEISVDLDLSENITRAEFSALVYRFMNWSYSDESQMFSDVPPEHWAIRYVNALVLRDVISHPGDRFGNFNPEQFITGNEAVKMIACALGYQSFATVNGGFPLGYVFAARRANIDQRFLGIADGNLTRRIVLDLITNALDAYIFEQTIFGSHPQFTNRRQRTALNEFHNIYILEGQVVRTDFVSLFGGMPLRSGEFELLTEQGNVTINAGGIDVNAFFGFTVKAFSRYRDGFFALVYMENDRTEELTVNARDIAGFNNFVFEYFDRNERLRTIRIPGDALIIYNNVAVDYTVFSEDMFRPEVGNIRFLRPRNSGNYNIVLINSYQSMLVSAIDNDNQIIFDFYTGDAINLRPDTDNLVRITDHLGNSINFSDIAVNIIVSVAVGIGGGITAVEAIVSPIVVTGPLVEISENRITVEQEEFYLAPVLVEWISRGHPLTLGEEYSFGIDVFGYVVSFSNMNIGNLFFGYVVGVYIRTGIEDVVRFRILSPRTGLTIYETNNRIIKNDVSVPARQAAEFFQNLAPTERHRRVIIYDIGENRRLSSVTVPEESAPIGVFQRVFTPADGSHRYKEVSRSFGNATNITDRTVVFAVPSVANEAMATDLDFIASTPAILINDANYTLDGFAMDPDALLLDVVLVDRPLGQGNISANAGFSLVSRVSQALNADGVIVTRIRCRTRNMWEELNVSVELMNPSDSELCVSRIRPGDIVRFDRNSRNEIVNWELVFEFSTRTTSPTLSGNDTIDFNSVTHTAFGPVLRLEQNVIRIDRMTNESTFAGVQMNYIVRGDIYIYDTARPVGDRISTGVLTDILPRDNVGYGRETMIFVASRFGDVHTMVIYR